MNKKYIIILFIIEMIYMTLELIASRLLSPYFGNTNIIWTSIIGIILLSSCFGNYFGGLIADKNENDKNLKIILFLISICISFIALFGNKILDNLSIIVNEKIGALFSTIILFFIPSLLIGMINPIIMKDAINDNEVGKTSGKVYAISTLGGIFGTFISGFILIPNVGSIEILYLLSTIVLVLSLLLKLQKNTKIINIITIIIIIINLILFNIFIKKEADAKRAILNGNLGITGYYDSEYNKILVYNDYSDEGIIRKLDVDKGFQSATYIEEEKMYDLVYEYTKYYDLIFKKDNVQNVLMIGGGGFSYPKYFISHYLDKNIDVVEIDSKVITLAKEYFYLDNLINDYNLDTNHRLKIYNEDGRIYLNKNIRKYDAILNDAFSGTIPVKTLTTNEAIISIKKNLHKDGIYITNIPASLDGSKSKFLKAEVKTLKTKFTNVYVVPVKNQSIYELQNIIVIATDINLDINNSYELNLEDSIILTDNYAPIEKLID